ncbi:hypothetical protein [Streptomyces sp. NPDC002133]
MIWIALLVPVSLVALMFTLDAFEDLLFPPSAPKRDGDPADEDASE